jgi:hypothetical protein
MWLRVTAIDFPVVVIWFSFSLQYTFSLISLVGLDFHFFFWHHKNNKSIKEDECSSIPFYSQFQHNLSNFSQQLNNRSVTWERMKFESQKEQKRKNQTNERERERVKSVKQLSKRERESTRSETFQFDTLIHQFRSHRVLTFCLSQSRVRTVYKVLQSEKSTENERRMIIRVWERKTMGSVQHTVL